MAAAATGDEDGGEEIRQLAREVQYDRYLAALLSARRHRETLIVLAAFAGELQRIPFLASEPMMAAIRLQWWRDELMTAANGNVRRSGHHLCDALLDVAASHNLPFGLMQGMIDAAEVELDATPLADAGEVRQVLIKFDAALFELAGIVLGANASRNVWHAAGIAYGAADRVAEFRWRQRRGLQVYTSREASSAAEAGELIDLTKAAMDEMRARYGEFDTATRCALLPLATVVPRLRLVAVSNEEAEAGPVALSHWARARAVLWAHWRRRL